jgi:hypothetical protein
VNDEDDELLCAYLTAFGIDTLDSAHCQEGEREFLIQATIEGRERGTPQNAWARIVAAYHRREQARGRRVLL